MRSLGYSTGAISPGNISEALDILSSEGIDVAELAALRTAELPDLFASLDRVRNDGFTRVSIHAPVDMDANDEEAFINGITRETPTDWLVIVHPYAIIDFAKWKGLGSRLCIENTDKRKTCGATATDLEAAFKSLPEASLCLDLGHAHQVDVTMTEAFLMIRAFGSRIKELHVSEVTSESRHVRLSRSTITAFQEVLQGIPKTAAIILETPVKRADILAELQKVELAFGVGEDLATETRALLSSSNFSGAFVLAVNALQSALGDQLGDSLLGPTSDDLYRILARISESLALETIDKPYFEWLLRTRNAILHFGDVITESIVKSSISRMERVLIGMSRGKASGRGGAS